MYGSLQQAAAFYEELLQRVYGDTALHAAEH